MAVAVLAVAMILGPSPANAEERPHIAAFGDSLLWESGDYLRFFAGVRGARVDVEATGGSALCDWTAPIQEAVADPEIDAVVIAFTGNNLTPCAQDANGVGRQKESLSDVYAGATARVMDAARPDLPVLWVTAPTNPLPNPTADAIRSVARQVPARWRNARVVDGGEHLTPRGRWSATQPCLFFEPCTGPVVRGVRHNVVRAPDGAHFCPVTRPDETPCPVFSSGALRYALTILGPALAAVGR